ncbi:dephospho-CoA kinase [mine drainage metagenome]|uniref:Dephospho-CoA kinase n=1 Tax=mine drainage metagenome TaxID=410659 RepID=T1B3E0_9ZZZZ
MLRVDGSLDRAALRRQVFGNTEARRALEAIVHPRVRIWLREHLQAADAPYALLAIPLLRETWPAYDWLDRVLVVDAPETLQRARLLQRDGIDAALAEAMLAAQADRSTRLALAHDVLDNRGTRADLRARVAALHADYLHRAAAR